MLKAEKSEDPIRASTYIDHRSRAGAGLESIRELRHSLSFTSWDTTNSWRLAWNYLTLMLNGRMFVGECGERPQAA